MNDTKFENILKYEFVDKALLKRALTHSSFCKEHGEPAEKSNERLEFLGDAFLDAIVGYELFTRQKTVSEGKLSKLRASIVCERSVARVGKNLDIGNYLNMGNGEELSGGRMRESIVSDAVEAIIGAVFMDGGYAEAERLVLREFGALIDQAISGKLHMDYKTELQEMIQKSGDVSDLEYALEKTEGPDHDKEFYITAVYKGEKMGSGKGHSKKEAEQNAAKASIEGEYLKNVL